MLFTILGVINHAGEAVTSIRLLDNSVLKSSETFPDLLPISLTTGEGHLSLFLIKNKALDLNNVKVTYADPSAAKRKKADEYMVSGKYMI